MADATRLIGSDDIGGLIIEGTITRARPINTIVRNSVDGGLYVSTNDAVPAYDILSSSNQAGANYVFVNEKSDFPAPSGGVITLAADTTYVLTTIVDLTGDRLVAQSDTALIGGAAENSGLKSTGLVGTALLSSSFTLPRRNIHIIADVALALDGSGSSTAFLVWTEVNFVGCGTIGTIENYQNTIMTRCQLLNSGALTFDGTHGTIAFDGGLIIPAVGATGIVIPATATVNLRFRTTYSSIVTTDVTSTGYSVDATAFPNAESYILDTANFSGTGTYITGLTAADNAALFVNCVGIENSSDVAQYFMTGNASATLLSGVSAGTFLKVAGTTTPAVARKFDLTVTNQAEYEGVIQSFFKITAVLTFTGGSNKQISARIAKNGTTIASSQSRATTDAGGRASAAPAQGLETLVAGDQIEVWIANNTDSTDITVTDMNLIITRAT